jgi:hypothetical protein
MFELSPASREALDEFCATLPGGQGDLVRQAVRRVCADPSGRRQPQHRYTRPFRNAKRYAPGLSGNQRVWEFKTRQCRGLFVTDAELRTLVFLPVSGRRFMLPAQAP